MRLISAFLCWVVTIAALATRVSAGAGANILVAQGAPNFGYHYGGMNWDNMTAAINAAAGSVTVTADLSNASTLMQHDALWIDQRWTTGSLTPAEVSNVTAFIATGRRVVMIGENDGWTNWNNQILGIVGGNYVANSSVSSAFSSAIAHPLTAGNPFVRFTEDGLAVGGTSVFTSNIVTLWGANQNVVTMLSVNAVSDDEWNQFDNDVFANNLANWIGAPVPAPAALPFLALGALPSRRRRR